MAVIIVLCCTHDTKKQGPKKVEIICQKAEKKKVFCVPISALRQELVDLQTGTETRLNFLCIL